MMEMTVLTYGSLFHGYGGLDGGVMSVLGGELAWYAEYDKAASKIGAFHHPDVPNLGDVTKVDWNAVPKVDVITGGSPCQDLSHAGKRAGMTTGTRSNLWVEMREAIAVIRPRLVVWENVRGALSAPADSALEPCPGCMGDADDGPVLRALGRVLGDLAELRYNAWWYGLRAADVGAAHGRFRVFLYATPADDAGGFGGDETFQHDGRRASQGHGRGVPDQPDRDPLRPGPDRGLTLLPTPAVNDMGASYTPETWDAWTERMRAEHGNGNGHGKSLSIEAQRLLPTPNTHNWKESGACRDFGADMTRALTCGCSGTGRLLPTPTTAPTTGNGHARNLGGEVRLLPTPTSSVDSGGLDENGEKYGPTSGVTLTDAAIRQDWREYEPAIRRAEAVFARRPAPPPTEPGAKGQQRLSPLFVEWLMGLPEGHVTDPRIGISLSDQLKALGNGVVMQQCAAATRAWLHDISKERAA